MRARTHPLPSLSHSSSQDEPESKAKPPQQEEGPKGRRRLGWAGPGEMWAVRPCSCSYPVPPGVDEQSDSSEESEEEKPPEEDKEEEEEKKAPTPQEKKRRKGVAPMLEARVRAWPSAASSPLPCRPPSLAVEVPVDAGSRGCSGPDPFPVPRRQQRGVRQLRGE